MSSGTTQQEAISSEERMKRFLAVASHDLQSPLRHIAMYSEILLEDLEGKINAEERHSLTTILEKVQAAQKLTKALMTFAAGTPQVSRESVDLAAVVETAWLEAKAEFPDARASLVRGNLAELRSDSMLLTAVFKHLFLNALAHGERASLRVEVSTRRDDGKLLITVADDGAGIDPDHQQRIFDAFWKLPKAGKVSGPGLGLTISRELVEALGGTIELAGSSESGSRFEIRLPA